MRAVRYAAFAIFAIALLIVIVFAFRPPAPVDAMHNTFYVAYPLWTFVIGFTLPTMSLALIVVATFSRKAGGARGLWLALIGAVLMTAPIMFYYVANDIGTRTMPRLSAADADAAGYWLSLGMTITGWVGLAGVVCVVVGAILWTVARRRRPRDDIAELFS